MKNLLTSTSLFLLPLALFSQVEICNNGIDDDGNGLVDLNDPGCPFSTALISPGMDSYIANHSFEERVCCPYGFASPINPPWLECATGWQQPTSGTTDYFHSCGYSPEGFNFPPPDGDGAVGFFAFPSYFEYIGTCLTYPPPDQPLLADSTYTLSLWISTAIVNDTHTQTMEQGSYVEPFTDPFPLAIFGATDQCYQPPVPTSDCIGNQPSWTELGRTYVQPSWGWTRVSITFTPFEEIYSIMIGGACDVPGTLDEKFILNPQTGEGHMMRPYYVIDDLMLTPAQDQVLQPVSVSGSICEEDVEISAVLPMGAADLQWYLNGVALPGETQAVLGNSTIIEQGGGTYAITSAYNGERLLGSTFISGFCAPPNDLCQNAEFLGPVAVDTLFDVTVGGDLTHATESRPAPVCMDTLAYTWRDVWYRLDNSIGDVVSISLHTDVGMPAGVEVLAGCTDTSIVCSTDGTPIELTVSTAGEFLIRVFNLEARDLSQQFELHVVVDRATAIGNIVPEYLSVHPNPGSGDFTITPGFSAADGTITVRDMTGRTVYLEQASFTAGRTLELALRGRLKTGAYLLEIGSSQERSVARLLVD